MDNIFWQYPLVTREERSSISNQKPCVLWFTGLSGAGKTTLATAIERLLFERGYHPFLLDGDNLRHGLNNDLSFNLEDRKENVRRVGEVCKLFIDAGLVVLAALISPVSIERERVRQLFQDGEFIEVHVSTPLSICEERDSKGLYKKARAGELSGFTGIDSIYEEPLTPEIRIDTSHLTIQQSAEIILTYLNEHGFLKEPYT